MAEDVKSSLSPRAALRATIRKLVVLEQGMVSCPPLLCAEGGCLKPRQVCLACALPESELELADHEPVIRALDISTPEDLGVLDALEVSPANQSVIDLVSSPPIIGDPALQMDCAVLKHGVSDNQAVACAQVENPLPVVGDLARQAKSAYAAPPLCSIIA